MQVILNVTSSLPEYPRLFCFYITNILLLEDNTVTHFFEPWRKKILRQANCKWSYFVTRGNLHKIGRSDHFRCEVVVYTQSLRTGSGRNWKCQFFFPNVPLMCSVHLYIEDISIHVASRKQYRGSLDIHCKLFPNTTKVWDFFGTEVLLCNPVICLFPSVIHSDRLLNRITSP